WSSRGSERPCCGPERCPGPGGGAAASVDAGAEGETGAAKPLDATGQRTFSGRRDCFLGCRRQEGTGAGAGRLRPVAGCLAALAGRFGEGPGAAREVHRGDCGTARTAAPQCGTVRTGRLEGHGRPPGPGGHAAADAAGRQTAAAVAPGAAVERPGGATV